MKKKTSYILIALVIVFGIIIDLLTKYFFARFFEAGGEDIIIIPNFFEFTYLKNTGAAYGMFGGNTIALSVVSLIFIIVFLAYDYFNHRNEVCYSIGFALILSGAIGNLVDRLLLGYVRDFISIKLFSFVFNLADLWITIGVICFAISLIISMIKESKGKKNNEVDNNN